PPHDAPAGLHADLATYLGKSLNRPVQPKNRTWDMLPHALHRGDVEMVLNGYEWTAEREQGMRSTIPYYAYRLRLIVHKNSDIQGWEDLKKGGSLRVGVLTDSAAHTYLEKHFPDLRIEALSDDGIVGIMKKVADGQMAATVQDAPVVSWYMEQKNQFPNLRAVGQPVAPVTHSYYVIYVRPEQATF